MTIADRVTQASERMVKGDHEGALFQICSALEATAAREYGRAGRGAYKQFIHENLELITRIGFRCRIANLNFGIDLNRFRPTDDQLTPEGPDGSFTIEQILYHVVRCDLYHNAGLPPHIEFGPEPVIRCDVDKVFIAGSIVNGLILSVVASPANVGHAMTDDFWFDFTEGVKLRLNKFWGKRDALRSLIAAFDAA
jgi:hypothetical protein